MKMAMAMRSGVVVVLSLLVGLVLSQTTHVVQVGNGSLTFDPDNIQAQIGDVIRFVFHPKNHTATQTTFQNPCGPTQSDPSFFDSDFKPVSPGTADAALPNFDVTVQNNQPIWVYCKQPGPPTHCGQGMVFSANAPTTGNTFLNFQAAALAIGKAQQANSTSTAPPTTHTIQVGGLDGAGKPVLKYDPPSITANKGDTVVFSFGLKNHTVTQSSFGFPCAPIPKELNGGIDGFDSGFLPPKDNVNQTFSITINDTKPIWGYCRQTGHCGQGMVVAINANTDGQTHDFDAYLQLALNSNATV